MGLTEIREKIRKTNLARYGAENPQSSKSIRNKTANTLEEKYGARTTFESTEIKEKIRKKLMETYGVTTPYNSWEIKKKAHDTLLQRYSKGHISHLHISNESLQILNDEKLFFDFISEKTVKQASLELNVDLTTIYDRIHKYNLSSMIRKESYLETEMNDFLINLGVTFQRNSRSVISPYELDFYTTTPRKPSVL